MQIQKISIDKLKAATYNPRKDLKPGDAEFEKLKRSILEFGYVEPAIWNKRTGNIVGGHQRVKVLKHLGYTEADCVVLDIDATQEKALNIALNKISGEWDSSLLASLLKDLEHSGYDLSMTGFDLAEIKDIFGSGAIENVSDDNFDENAALSQIDEPLTALGDIWQLGRHRLMCGDCTDQAAIKGLFEDKFADIMVTDPPYNVDYGKGLISKGITDIDKSIINDSMTDAEFRAFLNGFYTAANSVLKAGAVVYVFHSTKETVNFIESLKEAGFKYAQTLVWYKNQFTLGRQDYQWIHEPILYGWKEGAGHYFVDDRTNNTVFEDVKKDIKKLSKQELIQLLEKVFALQTTVIHENKPTKSVEHPTMKPVLLCAKLIYNSSRLDDLVYEPFGGSGSTLIAAEQLSRKCYVVELDRKYCDVIVKRWQTLTGAGEVKLIRGGEISSHSLV